MATVTSRDLAEQARRANYEVMSIEQQRANRWVLTLRSGGLVTIVLAQSRQLLSGADVQDLAELVRLRGPAQGILLALDGTFSPIAQQTLDELRALPLRFATKTLLAPSAEHEPRPLGVPLTRTP